MSRIGSLTNRLLDKDILLESGTNELEVLVFFVADHTFGVNVAKVREVLPSTNVTCLPQAHPSIRGVFQLRENVVPCVSLIDHLGIESTSDKAESTVILTYFNQQHTAFLVDSVDRIYRLSWEDILTIPSLDDLQHIPVTALARCGERRIVMLDFEHILADVSSIGLAPQDMQFSNNESRPQAHVLLADDSPTVRAALSTTLREAGYENLTIFENGAEAWAWISRRLMAGEPLGDLLVCDIEMPQMDGHHLCRRIKEHPKLKRLPIMLYSSIISTQNRLKGESVGADAQIAKPELTKVVDYADQLIAKYWETYGRSDGGGAAPPTAMKRTTSVSFEDDFSIESI